MENNTTTSKTKRTLTAEQKEKMRKALEAKKADPEWVKEQEEKRKARKEAKQKAKAETNTVPEKKVRVIKCSVCQQEGHNKSKCPQNKKEEDKA